MLRILVAATLAAGAVSCAASNAQWARARTAGKVPCLSDEIEIRDQDMSGGEWRAVCRGKVYVCGWAGAGIGHAGKVSCVAVADQ